MAKKPRVKQRKIYTSLEGAEEVLKLLEDLGEAAGEILEQAAESGGRVALFAARSRCPVDTGRLRDSLHLEKGKTRKPQIRQEVKLSPGKEEYYGTFVELGTSRQAAQPYLRPALDEEEGNIAKAVNREVLRALGRVR